MCIESYQTQCSVMIYRRDNWLLTFRSRLLFVGIPPSIVNCKSKSIRHFSFFFPFVDEGRMRQVITNFITNAAKFTPEGSITMGWKVNEDTNKVELYVEDTGIGLSEEDRKMVFSRFFKKDEFKQGTGLGLSICKLIVSRLGGSIKVKSQLGKGSRFSVFLSIQQN